MSLLKVSLMVRRSLALLLLVPFFTSFSQTRNNACKEQIISFFQKVPTFRYEEQRDSLRHLIAGISPFCKNEYVQRLEILLQIENNTYQESSFQPHQYYNLINYIEDEYFNMLMDSVHENPEWLYKVYYGVPELYFKYTAYTKELARSIAAKKGIDLSVPACDIQTMWLQAYGGYLEPFGATLKKPFCKSMLTQHYIAHAESIERKAKVDAALMIGTWIPYGNASTLGVHPSFGVLFGMTKKRMMYDLVFDFRTGSSPNSYEVNHQGSVVTTDHYFGGYFGIDIGYEFKISGRSRFYFLGGIGADGFDAIEAEGDREAKSFFVLNLNMGVGWKLFTRDGSYTGIDVKHNFINYDNPGGTPLDGNAFTLRLLYGIIKNDSQKREKGRLQNIIR